MDWNNINTDRDTSDLGPIEYDQSKVPALIRKHADNVRTKTYGQEVREAQARNAELAGLIASEAVDISNETKGRQDNVETQFNAVQQELTDKDPISAPEIIAARNGEATLANRLDVTDAQLARKVQKNRETIYLNEYIEKQGVEIDETVDISNHLQYCVNNYKNVIMPTGYTYYINSTVLINKKANIDCQGTIKVGTNVKAFIIGDLTTRVQECIFNVRNTIGTGRDNNGVLFSLQHAIYNQFHIPYARNIGKVVELMPIGSDKSIGENQIFPHLWHDYNIGLHIMGSDTWEERTWAEGTQLIAGFMSRGNYGVKIEENVLYSGMLITTAIDNADIQDSWDYYNGGTGSPLYNIANLLLFRFVRLAHCKFNNLDSYWDANLRLKTTAEIETSAAIKQISTDGSFTTLNGNAKIFNPSIMTWDYKNIENVDYDIRMQLQNKELKWGSPDSNAMTVTQDGFKVNRGKSNVSVAVGATNLTVNHQWAVASNNYTVVAVPKWETKVALQSKNTIGFNLTFDTPAPTNATLDYFVIMLDK